MLASLRRNDLLLDLHQQLLRFGQRQTQGCDVTKTIRPADRHHLATSRLTITIAVPTKRSVHSIRESPAGSISDRSYRSDHDPPINGRSPLIQRALETVGRTDTTKVTAFTDGCPGLRTVLVSAGVTKPPNLDWFHIAMRLQHTKLAAASLSTDDPDGVTAKAVIVAEVERLHWRIWNGKAKNAQRSIKRIRKVMVSRKLWHALHAVDKYLRGQAAWLVNYAKRYRAGLRVGTSITEGTANFLVNRRMNKSQQMRWSRRGADLLLQVRCAVYNGTLGAGFGHRFDRIADADPAFAKAA